MTGTVTWSDGTNFDGWLLLGLALPSNADGQWITAGPGDLNPKQRLPLWLPIGIIDGQFDQTVKVFFNLDLQPRNCRYAAYWYDINWRRIFPASNLTASLFDITSDPFTPTIPTLAAPVASVSSPAPEVDTTITNMSQQPSATQTLTAASEILLPSTTVQVSAAAPTTLTSTPTIVQAPDGTIVTVVNVGANDIMFQDNNTLNGSGLRLIDPVFNLSPSGTMKLMYLATLGVWLQI